MSIYYRKITVNTVEPTSPGLGEIWVNPINTSEYAAFIWLNEWIPLIGGGIYAAETNPDSHYLNVIVQEDQPDSIIQTGWIWIKESVQQAWLYLFGDYVPLIGV